MTAKTIYSMPRLKDYVSIAGESCIDELKLLASHLKGKKIQHISSRFTQGYITETLNRTIPLMEELGVEVEWNMIGEGSEFFKITRKFSEALCGRCQDIFDKDFDTYLDYAHEYIANTKIKGDIVFVHDLQPIALIQNKKKFKDVQWVWRCHTDISAPNERLWDFLSTFVEGYDASVFSSPKFICPLKIPQFIICPAIDPLNDRNVELSNAEISRVLHKYGIEKDKPIVSQISPFDSLKDPIGVIEAFKLVKKYIDARLVLAGPCAMDTPESDALLEEIKKHAKGTADIYILIIEDNDSDINALQYASSIIVQKSIKEDFGLNVAEALWKAKPVVASATGGIPLQIRHKYSGLLCYSVEGAALQIRQLLNNLEYAKRLGENGMEHIRLNFLITRLIREEMLLALALFHEGDIITL